MVQITDNWGYCNGKCIEGECYGDNFCGEIVDNNFNKSFTSFDGYLVVLPENIEN